jgi:hypothetical protein
MLNRVARWYILRPKISIWVNFGWTFNGRCLYILWYILWQFGIFSPYILVCSTKKNPATLMIKICMYLSLKTGRLPTKI